jgi:argonaute-like protein
MAVNSPSNCTLNAVAVEIDPAATIRIGVQPYESSEQLQSLRDEFRETHYFKRFSAPGESDRLVSVSLSSEHEPIGDKVAERKVKDVLWLAAPLVLESLLRFFSRHERPILAHKPLRIQSNRAGDQVLSESAPKGTPIPKWLEKKICYVFDTRTFYPEDGEPFLIVACDVRTSNVLAAPCSEILKARVPLEGRYVQIHLKEGDPRLKPKSKLVGLVARVQGQELLLEDYLDGYETVNASEVYLEPRRENISWCVHHLFPENAQEILESLDIASAKIHSGPERLRRIKALFNYLKNDPLNLAPGVTFAFSQILQQGREDQWFPRRETIRKPVLIFDPRGSRTDTWNERGLDKNGPYDQRFFTPKQPRIAVICQAEAQGQVEQFLDKFLEGLPSVLTGRGNFARAPYSKGFIRRYALENVHIEVFPTENASAEAYLTECRRAIAKAAESREEWDLAFVQIEEAFHQLTGDDNPYLVTKSLFMKHQIPVQEVTLEKMTSPASDLVFIMNDISIATYAKLNGIPWLLKSDSTIAHELVIGLGGYHISKSRIGPKERVVGITTVFTGDGNYVLENKTAAVPYDGYAEALLGSLRESVAALRKDQNWRPSDSIRLLFHTFQQVKDTEVTVVEKVMAELGQPNVQYAFVHFVDDHPFLILDETNAGAYFSRTAKKGVFAPERGLMLKLNRSEALLSFTGSREVKQPEDGLPHPVLLRLHRNSTFKDLTYIARQAFCFSCHSWRTFSPAPLPITILYSELIAKFLRSLDDVTEWDADAMLGKIGRMRWFL